MPRVAERIPERIAHLIFVSCCIPAQGATVMGTITPEVRQVDPGDGAPGVLDAGAARQMFCNDMDEAQTRFVLENLVPEAPRPMLEPVSLAGLALPIPRTYVKLLRDASLSPALQDAFIRNAGPRLRGAHARRGAQRHDLAARRSRSPDRGDRPRGLAGC